MGALGVRSLANPKAALAAGCVFCVGKDNACLPEARR
jgi:hypothetical protein